MSVQKLSLEALAEMDGGRIAEALAQALRRCEADCKDRPAVKATRSVSLQIKMVPVCDDGELDSVNVAFEINDKLPKRSSKSYNMRAVRGGLVFNDLSPEDVDQMTLDMVPAPKEVESNAG